MHNWIECFLKNKENNSNYIFVEEAGLARLKKSYDFINIYEFKHKGLTSLTLPFLNPKTRSTTLGKFYLIEI